jgi:hypothetical protein
MTVSFPPLIYPILFFLAHTLSLTHSLTPSPPPSHTHSHTHSLRSDGVMYMTSIAIDFWQPSFSRDSLLPLAASFSLLTKNDGVSERGSVSDLCSSEVVPEELFLFTDPVGEGE